MQWGGLPPLLQSILTYFRNMKRKKSGGRKAGIPNKVTGQMRVLLSDFMNEQWPNVQTAFSKLEPKEKVFAFTKLLPFITASYSAVNLSLASMSDSDLEIILMKIKQDNNEQENTIDE